MLDGGSGVITTAALGGAARAASAANQPVRDPLAGGGAAGRKTRIPGVTRSDEPYARRNDVPSSAREDDGAPRRGALRAGGPRPRRTPDLPLTTEQVAQRLGYSEVAVRRWIREGKLLGERSGAKGSPLRVRESEVERWQRARRTRPVDPGPARGAGHATEGHLAMSGYVWVDVSDAWHLAPRNVKPNSIFCKEHSKRGVKLYCSASHGKGKQWWVRCRTNPKEAAKSRGFYETDTEAQNVAAELRKELTKGSHADPDRGKITVSEWVDMWWKTKRAMDPHTRENYESYLRAHILPGLGHVSLDALLPLTVEQWLCGLPLEPSSARTVFSLLSAILEKAFVNDLMRRNPCKLIKLSELLGKGRRKRKVWSDERVTAVIRTVPERYKLAALVPAAAGLRQAEVFGLAVEDLDPDAGVIHVRRQLKLVGGSCTSGSSRPKASTTTRTTWSAMCRCTRSCTGRSASTCTGTRRFG